MRDLGASALQQMFFTRNRVNRRLVQMYSERTRFREGRRLAFQPCRREIFTGVECKSTHVLRQKLARVINGDVRGNTQQADRLT